MSYYDFDHFWSPEEVCPQKVVQESDKNLVQSIKRFFAEIFGQVLDRT